MCVCGQIVADGIYINGNSVKTDESAITGESDNLSKNSTTDPFLLSGTALAAGTCNMIVTAVGIRSQQVRARPSTPSEPYVTGATS